MPESTRLAARVNWKTTAFGIAQLMVVLGGAAVALLDDDPSTTINIELVVASLLVALQGIWARDADKSSQDNGIRR